MDRPLVGAIIGPRPPCPASHWAQSTNRRKHIIRPVGTGASDDDGPGPSSAPGFTVAGVARADVSGTALVHPCRGACHDRSGPDFAEPALVAVNPAGSEPAG